MPAGADEPIFVTHLPVSQHASDVDMVSCMLDEGPAATQACLVQWHSACHLQVGDWSNFQGRKSSTSSITFRRTSDADPGKHGLTLRPGPRLARLAVWKHFGCRWGDDEALKQHWRYAGHRARCLDGSLGSISV